MSAFGTQVEIKEGTGTGFKVFTGVENFKVVGINPTKEELEKIYGREINFTPEYVGTTKVTDSDGEREVPQIRLDFFLVNEDESLKTKVQFYVSNTHHKSASGKYRVINSFGKDTWFDKDHIKEGTTPDNMQWYDTDGMKVAKRGEVELISFLINLLNLPYDLRKLEDKSEAYARIDKQEWEKIFNGDVSLLKGIISGTVNFIGILLGAKTSGEGKITQYALSRKTLRGYVKDMNKADKYKYLLKDLDEAKANGALGNVDFGARDLVLREHKITPTEINAENVNQTDIFDTEPQSSGDDTDEWFD